MLSHERFFPDVTLYLPKGPLSPRDDAYGAQKPPETGKVDALRSKLSDAVNGVRNSVRIPWDQDGVLSFFGEVLYYAESDSGASLPLDNREITFVPRSDLVPEDPGEKERLAAKYGGKGYILKNIAGDCLRLADGRFRIRLGYLGQEREASWNQVMGTLAHEYGHTLGVKIDDPVFEEVKAYAFQKFTMRYLLGQGRYFIDGYYRDRVHDIAASALNQLLSAGIIEEAVIAHVTGLPFGGVKPNSYQIMLR